MRFRSLPVPVAARTSRTVSSSTQSALIRHTDTGPSVSKAAIGEALLRRVSFDANNSYARLTVGFQIEASQSTRSDPDAISGTWRSEAASGFRQSPDRAVRSGELPISRTDCFGRDELGLDFVQLAHFRGAGLFSPGFAQPEFVTWCAFCRGGNGGSLCGRARRRRRIRPAGLLRPRDRVVACNSFCNVRDRQAPPQVGILGAGRTCA